MPRTACRVRFSFSIIAKRTYSSPYSPKPMPGDTETFAFASSFFVNSSEPAARYGSGILAHTYIDAFGMSTIHPASCSPLTSTSRRFWYFIAISATQSCGPSSAAIAATWIGVNVP